MSESADSEVVIPYRVDRFIPPTRRTSMLVDDLYHMGNSEKGYLMFNEFEVMQKIFRDDPLPA